MSAAPRGASETSGDAAPLELVEQGAEAFGEDRDLRLLERDRHDPLALAGLEEEGAIARLADRARHESLGRIEDIAASGHGPNSIPIRRAPGSNGSVHAHPDRVPAAGTIGRRP